jgi:hypothetical protein
MKKSGKLFLIALFLIVFCLATLNLASAWVWGGSDDCGIYSVVCDVSGGGGTHFFET